MFTVERMTFNNSVNSYNVTDSVGAAITLAGDATINVVSGSHSISAKIQGTSGLTKTGPGTLTFGNNINTYTGVTRVEQGTLSITGDKPFGNSDTIAVVTGGDVTSTLTSIGDLLTVTATVDGVGSTWTSTGDFFVGSSGTGELNVQNGATVTSNNGILGVGTGSLGTATLDGAGSTWTSPVRIDIGFQGTGVVTVQNGADLVSSSELLMARFATSNGSLTVTGAGSTATTGGGLTIARLGTGTMTISDGGTMQVQSGTGTVTVASLAGSVGTLRIGSGGAAGILQAATVSGGSGNANLIFDHSDAAYSFAPALAGTLKVQHDGSGTTTLTGSRSYSGTTTVNAGKLVVSGTHTGATTYTVNPGGTLSGTGSIGTSLINHGRVAPGNPIGTFSNTGYTQSSTGTLEIEVGGLTTGTEHDRLSVSGVSNLDGRLEMSFVNGFVPAVGQQVVFLTSTGTVGSFDSIVSPNLASIAPGVAMKLVNFSTNRGIQFVAPATTIQFIDPAPTPIWSNSSSWLTSTVPSSVDIINLQNQAGAAQQVNVQAANAFVHQLSVAGNANPMTVAVKNNFTLSSTTSATIANNATVSLFGSGSKLVSPSIAVEAGGQLSGNGSVYGNVVVGSTSGAASAKFLPGDPNIVGLSAGNLSVVGNLTQMSAGETVIDFLGTSAGQYDTIGVTGSAQLGGKLTVNLQSGVSLPLGQFFPILTASSIPAGRPFEFIGAPGQADIFIFAKREIPEFGPMTAFIAGFPLGDMNIDGGVNMDDVQEFAKAIKEPQAYALEFGAFGAESGDFDRDGDLDFDDIGGFSSKVQGGLAAVLEAIENYGKSVPEPVSLASAVLGMIGFFMCRIRRRSPRFRS